MKLYLCNKGFRRQHVFRALSTAPAMKLLRRDCWRATPTFEAADIVEAGWSVNQPILDVWQTPLARAWVSPNYASPSPGGPSRPEEWPKKGRPRSWRRPFERVLRQARAPNRALPPGSHRNHHHLTKRSPVYREIRILGGRRIHLAGGAAGNRSILAYRSRTRVPFNVSLAAGSTPKPVYHTPSGDEILRDGSQVPLYKMHLSSATSLHVPRTIPTAINRMRRNDISKDGPVKH